MTYRLVVMTGALCGQHIDLNRKPLCIGRDAGAELSLPDEEVALRHALLEHKPHGLFIRDLGTMSHILVNKREVRESRLRYGDLVELGRTRFLVQSSIQVRVQERSEPQARWPRVAAVAAVIAVLGTASSLVDLQQKALPPASVSQAATVPDPDGPRKVYRGQADLEPLSADRLHDGRPGRYIAHSKHSPLPNDFRPRDSTFRPGGKPSCIFVLDLAIEKR